MVMILLFITTRKAMDKLNSFFLQLFKKPALLWKLGAALIFVFFAGAIFLMPSLIQGLSDSSRKLFAGVLLAYGIFRFVTFYMEYKQRSDD